MFFYSELGVSIQQAAEYSQREIPKAEELYFQLKLWTKHVLPQKLEFMIRKAEKNRKLKKVAFVFSFTKE